MHHRTSRRKAMKHLLLTGVLIASLAPSAQAGTPLELSVHMGFSTAWPYRSTCIRSDGRTNPQQATPAAIALVNHACMRPVLDAQPLSTMSLDKPKRLLRT
ncbi:putative secreted protein [Granulibacter bethesdensis]|nr:putative secreted protein [Granulibacter bethesdensis]